MAFFALAINNFTGAIVVAGDADCTNAVMIRWISANARDRNMAKIYALSLKQPWAALLVSAVKSIEVRRWPTARRGRILIHAARIPDERPQAWAHVPPELAAQARQLGGIVGAAELDSCAAYRSLEAFVADREQHLNEPDWYEPPVLYGFRFRAPEVLPFHRYSGWMRFFPVDWHEPGSSESPSP
jgi:hypothetical protein